MKVRLKQIVANPFRNIDNYPIDRGRVADLRISFRKTTWWGNVVVRRRKDGKYELAHGHHRWIALLEEYGPETEVDVILMDFSDAEMIISMASENMDDRSTSAIVEIETVEAVVKAFGADKIKLPKADERGQRRVAPSFIPSSSGEQRYAYNAQSIGEFLGWVQSKTGVAQRKIQIALIALQYIEEGLVELRDFADMGTKGIEAVITQASRVRAEKEAAAKAAERIAKESARIEREAKEREAKERAAAERYRQQRKYEAEREAERREAEAARERARAEAERKHQEKEAQKRRSEGRDLTKKVTAAVGDHIRSGGGTKTAGDVTSKVVPREDRGAPADIEQYLARALHEVFGYLNEMAGDTVVERLNRVLEYKGELDEDVLINAEKTIRSLAGRANFYADKFHPNGSEPATRNAKTPTRIALQK